NKGNNFAFLSNIASRKFGRSDPEKCIEEMIAYGNKLVEIIFKPHSQQPVLNNNNNNNDDDSFEEFTFIPIAGKHQESNNKYSKLFKQVFTDFQSRCNAEKCLEILSTQN
ncbi:MAG: hypothetical protein KDK40_00015, partial [Chlamydiia bacterium]|nr:hypothetical protein [Chlamydiia bacterium]